MEFQSLERCAAYVAARSSLATVQRAAHHWPPDLAERAHAAALETVAATAEALDHEHASPGRRRCLRNALATALELAAACDIANALGHTGEELDESIRAAGRMISLLAMFLHATSGPARAECG